MTIMKTTSYWLDSLRLAKFPLLSRNLRVDVVVVGGGITGITAAYLIKQAGYTVALLERGRCAHLDTGHTTAHLTCVTDKRLHQLVKDFGKDRARAVWEAGFAAIDQIVANIRAQSIRCEFKWVPGYLHAAFDGEAEKERKLLEKDAEMAQELGFSARFVESAPYLAD